MFSLLFVVSQSKVKFSCFKQDITALNTVCVLNRSHELSHFSPPLFSKELDVRMDTADLFVQLISLYTQQEALS